MFTSQAFNKSNMLLVIVDLHYLQCRKHLLECINYAESRDEVKKGVGLVMKHDYDFLPVKIFNQIIISCTEQSLWSFPSSYSIFEEDIKLTYQG